MNYRVRNIPARGAVSVADTGQFSEGHVLRASIVPQSIIRYTYYAFIFSLPFESADIEIGGLMLSRLLGFVLVAVVLAAKLLYQRRLQLAAPPKAFWCFVGYFVVNLILGLNTVWSFPEESELAGIVIQGFKTLVQLLILFWISYDMMQYERIARGALISLAVSCFIVALIQSLGVTGDISAQDRTAAFDTNANRISGILSLGLLVVIGLAFGKAKSSFRTRLFFWLSSVALAAMVVVTGSRGSMLGLVLALLVFFLHGRSPKIKLRVGLVVLLVIGFLGWVSFAIQPVRERWERTYYEGDTAAREAIFSVAWEMFLERPLGGWGPANNLYEVGSRFGLGKSIDTHNTFLWLLTETGLLGTLPFMIGLWLCWCAALRARHGSQGALPMALMVSLLIRSMSGTDFGDKLFWIVLAYALASANYVSVGRGKHTHAYPARNNTGREPARLHRPPEVAA